MPPLTSSLALRLALAYVALFSVVGIWMPYWQAWLSAQGFGTATVGVIVGMASWSRLVANPVVAWVSARRGMGKTWLRWLSGTCLLGYLAFFVCESAWTIGALAFAVGLVYAPIGSLLDGVAIANAQHGKVDYGRVRLWGSLSFVGASWFMGTVLQWLPDAAILPALCLALAWTHLSLWLLPSSAYTFVRPVSTPSEPPPTTGLRTLLHTPGVILTVSLASLLNASHTVLYGFGTLLWREDGLSQGQIGWLWAEGVIAEVVLFGVAGRCFRGFKWRSKNVVCGPTIFLIAAALGGLVRWLAMAYTSSFAVLVGLQLLHALSFGAQHAGYIELLARIVEPRQMPTAVMLSTAMLSGLTLGVATPLAGLLCEHFGRSSYGAMAAISVLAVAVAWVAHRRLGKVPMRATALTSTEAS